jgi:hypothetical protein
VIVNLRDSTVDLIRMARDPDFPDIDDHLALFAVIREIQVQGNGRRLISQHTDRQLFRADL